ncbi:DUF3566 domain-containing protein [Streptomyces olivochromogenes]|uniref:Membrane protein n=1 Tax=Streptomyces olivochromogenes TaxID=1963 RepID=A0A250VJ91_STROL|nr:DUF3566 domain-containing protein [Streptomyces olivochromogenes]KUN43082.1 hypothetical protein AQJ27_33160 [Streptomyces olivochromogenes]GAX54119.1 membrane protein [Streptomyces olivochromogenes]
MSGATGAGSTGTDTDGGRGSAAETTDSHDSHGSQGGTVTDTRGPQAQQYAAGAGPAAAGPAKTKAAPGSAPPPGAPSAGSTASAAPVGAAPEAGSALPGERQPQQPAQPYHPPQAYPAQTPSGAVRLPRTGARTAPRTRKARLRVAKTDPWSVMKVSFLLSIALGICTIVAAAVLWMVLDAMGVFSTVGGTISEATGSNESNGFDLQSFLSLPHVLMFTSIIAVIDVVLATALATLGSFIYNLSAGFVGGIELTLAEDE